MKKSATLRFLLLFLSINFGVVFGATYQSVKITELDFGDQAEAAKKAFEITPSWIFNEFHITVRSQTECYAAIPLKDDQKRGSAKQGDAVLVFHLEKDQPVRGFIDLYVDSEDDYKQELKGFAFTFTPGKETASTEEHFNEIRSLYFAALANNHLPGTAWFKHHVDKNKEIASNQNWQRNDLSESFGIFSGGRAISENLALDRELIISADKDGKTFPVSEIKGVTVEKINWSSRLPKEKVVVDMLSLALPEDQHAVFAKNLPDLLALIERAETQLIPTAQAYSVRSPFRVLASRYRIQMGLDVPLVAARLLPANSVAITGGDPFFPQGTDVAFVMESDTPELLYKALLKTVSSKAAKAEASATELAGEGFDYSGFQNADRSFSSHVWRMGNVVAVSNSAMQIRRLIDVANKKMNALGSTDEFRFFRNRYKMDKEESAFIFLSDETIRRWAGPELRIAASRRTRAVAALGELTSQVLAGEKLSDTYKPLLGETVWKDGHLLSSVYGSLGFITPSSELKITTTTAPEAEAYGRWRDGYENGWAQAFDPIAISIRSDKDFIDFDLSVMPLTVDSDFSELISLCGKAELSDMARWIPEESVLHAALAIDTKNETFHKFDNEIIEFLPGLEANPLSWMTGSVSMDLEKSLFWQANINNDSEMFGKTPIIIRIGSNSRLKLALFMTAIRGAINTTAPDSVTWETRKKDDNSYVVISGDEEELGASFHIYYATMPNALLISLREDSLLRAIKRETHKLSPDDITKLPAPTQMMLDSSPSFLSVLAGIFDSSEPLEIAQKESWKAIPILNEWHNKLDGKDPLAVQLLHFGEDIFCPGGKGYRWNTDAMTMESVAFGYPAQPRSEPADMPGITNFKNLRTSLKFEDDGLRASVYLGVEPQRLATPKVEVVDGKLLATAKELTPVIEGMTLSYVGTTSGMKSSMKMTTQNVVKKDDKTTFDVVIEAETEGEDSYTYTMRYVLDKSLAYISEFGDEGATNYDKPFLDIPEKLISGEVTRGSCSGVSEWKQGNGEITKDAVKNEFEIRVIGKEDIEVPAGKFADCIKIEYVGESINGDIFNIVKNHIWYSPSVGIVKYKYSEGENSKMELQKVSIPKAKK